MDARHAASKKTRCDLRVVWDYRFQYERRPAQKGNPRNAANKRRAHECLHHVSIVAARRDDETEYD